MERTRLLIPMSRGRSSFLEKTLSNISETAQAPWEPTHTSPCLLHLPFQHHRACVWGWHFPRDGSWKHVPS